MSQSRLYVETDQEDDDDYEVPSDFTEYPDDMGASRKKLKIGIPESVGSHGLSTDEPLSLEKIIKDCYDNPNRLKHPGFFQS